MTSHYGVNLIVGFVIFLRGRDGHGTKIFIFTVYCTCCYFEILISNYKQMKIIIGTVKGGCRLWGTRILESSRKKY
jgi:hypothetical protein